MNESLENVKVGDKLLVRARYGDYVETVERITATLVVTDKSKYIKKSGKQQGCSSWSYVWAYPASPEDVERVAREKKRRELLNKAKNVSLDSLSDSQLEEFLKIVNIEQP